jgi:hypothetical protein
MTIRMPAELGVAGQMLWKMIVDRDPPYVLRPDEMYILMQACNEADIIARLQAALDRDLEAEGDRGLISKGSMGQEVVNPLVPELRQHRSTQMNLLKSLKLPDEKGAGKPAVSPELSETRRAAARARWQTPKEA